MSVPLFLAIAYAYCCLVTNRKCERPNRTKPSISFGGCGMRYHFYGGVAEYLLDNFDTKDIDISCVSGGIYAATILALGRKMPDWCDRDWQTCYTYWTNRWLYVFLDSDTFQRNIWRNYLPCNAYQICSDRLFVTISRLGIYGFYEEVISEFASNEELIDAIIGTIHIPGMFRFLPTVRGKCAFDGCYSNLVPRTRKNTLVVKLFGRGHIDYGNRIPMSGLMTIVSPCDTNNRIREGYEIASSKYNTFVECGFTPLIM